MGEKFIQFKSEIEKEDTDHRDALEKALEQLTQLRQSLRQFDGQWVRRRVLATPNAANWH